MLEEAFASVMRQDLQPLEVFVSDSDPAESDFRGALAMGHRTRCVSASLIGGRSYARNRGAQEAKGEWLAFLDDDDYWLPDYLAQTLDRAMESGTDLIDHLPENRAGLSGSFPG